MDAGQGRSRSGGLVTDPARLTDEQGRRLSRRALLSAAGAGAVALALPVRPRLAGLGLAATKPVSFKRALPIPPTITAADIAIDIRQAAVPILPGRKTRMWTYAGSFPGPTIRRPAGQQTRVSFTHRLPAKVGELSVHLHGGHTRSDDDGQPGGLTRAQPRSLYCDISSDLSRAVSGNDLLISPGETRLYTYDLVEDGAPERAAFQWYHDHRLEQTARNVWHGLAGMWIIDDELDASLGLPAGDREVPLLIADRSFDRHNQLTDPFGAHAHAPDDGITGEFILVNGAHLPHHDVAGARHRIRILNASQFRSYNVALSNGASMLQVATESGLMPAPISRKQIVIGPAERVEVVVDFAPAAGKRVQLVSASRKGHKNLGSKTFAGPLMEFRVGQLADDPSTVPGRLRPLPEWVAGASRTPKRTWKIGIGSGLLPRWEINGKTFDPARSDAFPAIDTTETWEFQNGTKVAHLIHIHSTDWYMLSRNGKPPPPWEDCLKETFFLDPGDRIVVAGHFSDHLGRFVVHCHMLDHEDHALMSQYEVVT
ncbi:MAG: multicopper oxidase family protein [Solirubrobacterales bacterium]